VRAARPWLAALGLYCLATGALGRSLWAHLDDSIIGPGDLDNFYYAWSFWEFRRALLAGRPPGITNDVYGQASSIPIFSEGFLDHLVAVPLQSFLTPVGAYNVTVLLSFPLAAMAMYLLASAFTRSWPACFVAGLIFGFSTYHLARAMGHLGLANVEMLPFCAWCLVAFRRRPSGRTAVLGGVGAGLVPWASIYYVAYFLLPLALVFLAFGLVREPGWFAQSRHVALLGLSAGVGALVAMPSLIDYPLLTSANLAAVHAQASRWQLRLLSANLGALVLPDPSNPLLGARLSALFPKTPGVPERSQFLGYPGLLLAVVAVVARRRDQAVITWLAVALAGILLALGPGLRVGDHLLAPLPFYDALYGWPLLDDFRAPNRLLVLTLVAMSVLAALGVAALLLRLPSRGPWRSGAGVAVVAVVAAGLAPNLMFGYGLASIPVQVPGLYRALAAAPDDGTVLEIPSGAGSAQYFQTVTGKRLATGVVPRLPDPAAIQLQNVPYYPALAVGWRPPGSDLAPAAAGADIHPLERLRDGMREHGISYLVLHRLGCIEPAALWPCYRSPSYEQTREFLVNSLGSPFYDSAGEGLAAWHVPPGPDLAAPTITYRLGAGWVPYLSLQAGEPERAIGSQAEMLIRAGATGEWRLRLRASSYVRPATLEVRFNGRPLGAVRPPVGAASDLDLGTVVVRAGDNRLELRSREGCVVPNDQDPANYDPGSDVIGYRCVSAAIQRVVLEPV
jgi:hypothetical protein